MASVSYKTEGPWFYTPSSVYFSLFMVVRSEIEHVTDHVITNVFYPYMQTFLFKCRESSNSPTSYGQLTCRDVFVFVKQSL